MIYVNFVFNGYVIFLFVFIVDSVVGVWRYLLFWIYISDFWFRYFGSVFFIMFWEIFLFFLEGWFIFVVIKIIRGGFIVRWIRCFYLINLSLKIFKFSIKGICWINLRYIWFYCCRFWFRFVLNWMFSFNFLDFYL